jgi:uncharacterized alpha-E superfamily protein
MLSRTADHLYWMSRYVERAVNLARMIDAHQRLALLPRSPEVVLQGWTATLVSLGADDAFRERFGAITPRAAFDFLAFDREHPGSILQCLRAARENARAVRGTITSDLWESLNATYLESLTFSSLMPESARGEFLELVKYRTHLMRGVASGTLPRDEATHFTAIGRFLERADNTTRMLEARWRDPGGCGERLIPEATEWAVLLRAMSAFEVFRRLYREGVTPQRVTEMLLMRDEHSSETLRRIGELHAQFHFGRFEELCADGVPQFLDRFQARLHELGERIANDFLVPAGI